MKIRLAVTVAVALLATAALDASAARQPRIEADVYQGRTEQDAAKALLERALAQAGKGSWERIAVGRVFYLGGHKAEGRAIFDAILAEPEDSDVYRIARVYAEAGEWDAARPLFDRYLAANPKDEKALAEVGAHYLLNGDRAGAERLFARSFAIAPEFWATIAAAGAYLRVAPQE
ncbi:MAG: tetratricopeptide repeat protein [Xanthomonadales bacterium]|nr:tetratricopeptide repeat protein [Xanthomonadales bacterium]